MTAGTKKKKRIWIAVVASVLALLVAADVLGANYLVSFAILRREADGLAVMPESETSQEADETIHGHYTEIAELTEEWLETARREDAEILSHDGLRLVGDLFPAEEDSHLWLLSVHGYTGRRAHMYSYDAFYARRGFNVLDPDLRASGESEGEYIGMGWLDRLDVLQWIDYILARDPEAEIVLHGVSMGGATVLMTAGEDLPENVKAIVDDCGYTSVWDVFSDEMAYLFHLPAFPLLHTASVIAVLRAGYSFREASALRQVEKAAVPIFFTHGSVDNFVHTDMVYALYDACPTEKELYVVEGAGHGQAMFMDPEEYFSRVFAFLDAQL